MAPASPSSRPVAALPAARGDLPAGFGRLLRGLRFALAPSRFRFALLHAIAALLPELSAAPARTWLYKLGGIDVHPTARLYGRLQVGNPGRAHALHIGAGATIGPGFLVAVDADVWIGEHAAIGPQVSILTASHAIGFGSCRMLRKVQAKAVHIEAGASLGASSLVLPGVTVGAGAVASPRSVLAVDVEPNALVAGNPAVAQRALPFGDP